VEYQFGVFREALDAMFVVVASLVAPEWASVVCALAATDGEFLRRGAYPAIPVARVAVAGLAWDVRRFVLAVTECAVPALRVNSAVDVARATAAGVGEPSFV
jgi:hypothetical protein